MRRLIPAVSGTRQESDRRARSRSTGLGRGLRTRPRSYLDLIGQLDLTEARSSDLEALLVAATEGLEALGLPEAPWGIVARCYLGHPYEVHTLVLAERVVTHYRAAEAMPEPFERARTLALHDAYVLIEVYADKLRCVREDGSVTTI